MDSSKNRNEVPIKIDGWEIPQCANFCYVGSAIQKNGETGKDI